VCERYRVDFFVEGAKFRNSPRQSVFVLKKSTEKRVH